MFCGQVTSVFGSPRFEEQPERHPGQNLNDHEKGGEWFRTNWRLYGQHVFRHGPLSEYQVFSSHRFVTQQLNSNFPCDKIIPASAELLLPGYG